MQKQTLEAPPSAAKGSGSFWLVLLIGIVALLTIGQAGKHGWDNVIGNAFDLSKYQGER